MRKVIYLLTFSSLILISLVTIKYIKQKLLVLKVNNTLKQILNNKNTNYIPHFPTLQTIFNYDHNWTATLSAEHIRKILVTGDIIPARSVNYGVVTRNNSLWPYEKVTDKIRQIKADITLSNLESPLIKDCPLTTEGMIFCGSERNVEGLKAIGVNIVSLANNHAGNYGVEGVENTISVLQENGIDVTGVSGPVYKNIKGIRFAFLGYNDITSPQPGISNVNENRITKEIIEAKQNSDLVIITFHWGVEYRSQPDERQKYLAHFAIDKGADLIVSNHPHWIQPLEIYKNKIIMYAHGNFIFDQMWSKETEEGVLGVYTFYDKQLIDIQFLPIKIYDYGQARFTEGEERDQILNKLMNESLKLNINISDK